jgi:hypothetical protein
MSTLLGELEQARRRSKCGAPGDGCFGCAGCDLADRLQKRIEHVKRLQEQAKSKAVRTWVEALTGDL